MKVHGSVFFLATDVKVRYRYRTGTYPFYSERLKVISLADTRHIRPRPRLGLLKGYKGQSRRDKRTKKSPNRFLIDLPRSKNGVEERKWRENTLKFPFSCYDTLIRKWRNCNRRSILHSLPIWLCTGIVLAIVRDAESQIVHVAIFGDLFLPLGLRRQRVERLPSDLHVDHVRTMETPGQILQQRVRVVTTLQHNDNYNSYLRTTLFFFYKNQVFSAQAGRS